MSQKFNIFVLIVVLAVPFALSSQTRKALPAGRYEALSGVKNSRVVRTTDPHFIEKKDSVALFWNEVLANLPENTQEIVFYSKGAIDDFATNLFVSKGIKRAGKLDESVRIVYTDNFVRDLSLLKAIKNKRVLVVLKDRMEINELLSQRSDFDVLLYQAEEDGQFFNYLLRLK